MRWQDDRGEGEFEDALKRFLQDIADHCSDFPEAVTVQTSSALPSPAVSIEEVGQSYFLTAELPGVAAGNLRLTATGRSITLEGDWTSHVTGSRPICHRNETRRGSFTRVVPFPGAIRGESARAILANGLLTVEVEKAASAEETSYEVLIP